MNERIRQLALEAGIGFTLWDDSGREMIDNYTPEEDLAKFAELLVKECVEIADKSNQGSKSSNEGTEFYYNADIGDKIKHHFGVEE